MDIPLLTLGESRVYEALIVLGDSSVGNILKHSKVSHSKVYDVLKRLEHKGLVSNVIKNGRQVFAPAHPSRLKELLKTEQERITLSERAMNDSIKRLTLCMSSASSKSVLRSFEGFQGVKTIVDGVLETVSAGNDIYILGSPKEWGDKFGGYMIDWEQRRLKTGAKCWILADADAPSWNFDWWLKSKKRGLTVTKRSSFKAPSYLIITKQSVITIHAGEPLLALFVQHEGIARRYCEFFLELWKRA